jgi:hypothetical protein
VETYKNKIIPVYIGVKLFKNVLFLSAILSKILVFVLVTAVSNDFQGDELVLLTKCMAEQVTNVW